MLFVLDQAGREGSIDPSVSPSLDDVSAILTDMTFLLYKDAFIAFITFFDQNGYETYDKSRLIGLLLLFAAHKDHLSFRTVLQIQ